MIEIVDIIQENDQRKVTLSQGETIEIVVDGVARYTRTIKTGKQATVQFSVNEVNASQ